MPAMARILLIQAHPDASARHFGHELADCYAAGAVAAGHEVRRLALAELDFPLLRSQHDWMHGSTPPALLPAQEDILWADHLVIFFPLWLGDMPALLKGFLEQVARPGFAFAKGEGSIDFKKALGGRSARVVVTMGMPAALYRWFFRAHSVKSLERNILGFVGIAPVHQTLIGSIESKDPKPRQRWLRKLAEMGARGE
jgi:putative NADPH-quinone reductase